MADFFQSLLGNVTNVTWQMAVMWAIGALLIYLAIKKDMEPSLLLPMGFGAILVNLPVGSEALAPIKTLFDAGIENELFPLLLFIGIGAMCDFGPLLNDPKLMLFGAAAQFGIFFTLSMASMFGFSLRDAASIAVIGAADGPTSIVVAQQLRSGYLGAIMVAAYSYMALVPIVQPPVIRLLTTKKERLIRMPYEQKNVSKTTRILFPIIVTMVVGIIAPGAVALIGFLMFGNLLRECGVLDSLSQTSLPLDTVDRTLSGESSLATATESPLIALKTFGHLYQSSDTEILGLMPSAVNGSYCATGVCAIGHTSILP